MGGEKAEKFYIIPRSMALKTYFTRQLRVRERFGLQLVAIIVAAHGVFVLATTLLDLLAARHTSHLSAADVNVPLIVGLSLLYLSALLRRRKRTAWLATVLSYTFYLGLSLTSLIHSVGMDDLSTVLLVRAIVLPASILALLIALQSHYVVKSDIQGFAQAVRSSLLILFVSFLYGITGFTLLDKSDFHQEISPFSAVHYTVDQFDLTTSRPLVPHTKRAQLFADSLSFISVGAVGYAVIALFQPIRARLVDQMVNRRRLAALLERGGAHSEDFFKLWPYDKQFFFDQTNNSGLAFHVRRGVALCLGDPAGDKKNYGRLLDEFAIMCESNDWQPAHVHVEPTSRKLYESHGYSLQKIGEEAVVAIAHFQAEVARNKYFRHINNKFSKQEYRTELLLPPHHPAVLARLRTVSSEWLKRGGRTERGFAMGYFSDDYMQQCPLMIVRDAAGTIQAFLNQLPAAAFDSQEATYDLLRHSNDSPGNINDYLLLNFIDQLAEQQYGQLNLGLCPLTGLADNEAGKSVIDTILRFAYANGDRFYSFSGLHRFKAKYEPEWRDRFIAYQGGLSGFTRTANALVGAMRVKNRP